MEDVVTVEGWRFLKRWIHLPLKYLLVVASVLCFRLIGEGDVEEDHQALEVLKMMIIDTIMDAYIYYRNRGCFVVFFFSLCECFVQQS